MIPAALTAANSHRAALRNQEAAAVDAMRQAWADIGLRLSAEIERVAASIDGVPTPGQLLRLERYNALLGQVGAEIDAFMPTAAAVMNAGQSVVITEAGLQAAQLIRTVGYEGAFNTLPAAAVENLVGVARAGQPLGDLLAATYLQAADGIAAELISGLGLGLNGRAIARRVVQRGLTRGFGHVALVARDQLNSAFRLASMQAYRVSGVVTHYQRLSALDNRVCPACLLSAGQVFPISTPFDEHVQGRCTPVPIVPGAGNVIAVDFGRNWFLQQSESDQRRMLGPGRFDLWKEGKNELSDFVKRTENSIWGGALVVRPVKELKR